MALDSCAQFLAVAEHRLIPSRSRSVCHQLRRAGHHSVWAPACQDSILGGHAGVGVVSLGGAPLALPSFVTPEFRDFFRLGRVLRTTLPTSQGGVVHLFVVYGYQWAEEDAEKLRLTDHLRQAVLVEAQMVCIGQPMLIAGDLNADPAVVPCLAEGTSVGRSFDLALAYSLGAGLTPGTTCTFNRDDGTGSRRDFFVGCPGALAASQACDVTDRRFTPHLSVIVRFRIDAWKADVACPVACQPIWPACWLDITDKTSSSSSRLVQDVWDVYRDELGVVPTDVFLALRDAVSTVDDFWSFGVVMRRQVYFGRILLLEVLLMLADLPFLEEVCYVFVAGVWEAELLVARPRAGYIVLAKMMRLIIIVLSFFINSSLSPVLLFRRRLKSVADVLKGFRSKGFTQSRWDALIRYWDAVCRHSFAHTCKRDQASAWFDTGTRFMSKATRKLGHVTLRISLCSNRRRPGGLAQGHSSSRINIHASRNSPRGTCSRSRPSNKLPTTPRLGHRENRMILATKWRQNRIHAHNLRTRTKLPPRERNTRNNTSSCTNRKRPIKCCNRRIIQNIQLRLRQRARDTFRKRQRRT